MSNRALTWAFDQPIKSAGRKFVLVALADMADEANSCWPGQELIAHRTGQSMRSVRDHLVQLETDGYLVRTQRRRAGKRSSDRYTLPVSVAVGVLPAIPAGSSAPLPADSSGSEPEQAADLAGIQPADLSTSTGRSRQVTQREPSPEPTGSAGTTSADADLSSPPVAKQPDGAKGTRLPEDWKRSERDREWQASEDIPDDFARIVTDEFKRYWAAKPGAQAKKLDWSKTWRNWVTREWHAGRGSAWRREHGVQSSRGGGAEFLARSDARRRNLG